MITFKDVDFANPKQFITQTIPGIFALIPYAYLLFLFLPNLKEFSLQKTELFVLIYLFFSILLGALINEIGSWIENNYDGLEKDSEKEWNSYLLQQENNLIIHSVISAVVMRLKFNINMLVSIVLFDLGLVFVSINNKEFVCLILITIFLSSFIIIFLYKMGDYMSQGLHKYRKLLNENNTKHNLQIPSQRKCWCKRQRS